MKTINIFKTSILCLMFSAILFSCQEQESETDTTSIEKSEIRNALTDITASYSDGFSVQMISYDNVNVELLCSDGAILSGVISETSISILDQNGEELWYGDIDYIPSQVNGYSGDCDLLGGRGSGESYSDCFERNWTNFCCDAVGCLSQAISPGPVAIAIGLACAISSTNGGPRDLDMMWDNANNQPLYN